MEADIFEALIYLDFNPKIPKDNLSKLSFNLYPSRYRIEGIEINLSR